jgi:SAM-dependent methyltransferase
MSHPDTTTVAAWGDFTFNAEDYARRPNYSPVVLKALVETLRSGPGAIRLAEFGAGTGNFLRSLAGLEVCGFAVEPNPRMREIAHRLSPDDRSFEWVEGTAERSGLADASVDWVVLANAYQFVDPAAMISEACRVLRPRGYLTIIWNLRDFAEDALQSAIEARVRDITGPLKRTGLAVDQIMESFDAADRFDAHLYVEAGHRQIMDPEQLLATWKAGHDVPSQVSPQLWADVVAETARMIPAAPEIETFWLTRAWTMRARD